MSKKVMLEKQESKLRKLFGLNLYKDQKLLRLKKIDDKDDQELCLSEDSSGDSESSSSS